MSDFNDVLAVLKKRGGYFVLPNEQGEEYVVVSKEEFDKRNEISHENQLNLLSGAKAALAQAISMEEETPSTPDEMLQRINRDIAVWKLQQVAENDEEGFVDVAEGEELEVEDPTETFLLDDEIIDDLALGGKQVKFEPLKGDLSPDLQE